MKIMNISYNRKFNLDEKSINKIIQNYGKININSNISLNLSNIKKSLSFIPIELNSNIFEFSHPLGSFKRTNGKYVVFIGNKKITTLRPQYFKKAIACPNEIEVEIDAERFSFDKAADIVVNDNFKVIPQDGIRVNVIGFTSKGVSDESGIRIHKNSLIKKFSVDNESKAFRVEFYKGDAFCSMSIVHFR